MIFSQQQIDGMHLLKQGKQYLLSKEKDLKTFMNNTGFNTENVFQFLRLSGELVPNAIDELLKQEQYINKLRKEKSRNLNELEISSIEVLVWDTIDKQLSGTNESASPASSTDPAEIEDITKYERDSGIDSSLSAGSSSDSTTDTTCFNAIDLTGAATIADIGKTWTDVIESNTETGTRTFSGNNRSKARRVRAS